MNGQNGFCWLAPIHEPIQYKSTDKKQDSRLISKAKKQDPESYDPSKLPLSAKLYPKGPLPNSKISDIASPVIEHYLRIQGSPACDSRHNGQEEAGTQHQRHPQREHAGTTQVLVPMGKFSLAAKPALVTTAALVTEQMEWVGRQEAEGTLAAVMPWTTGGWRTAGDSQGRLDSTGSPH